jgi:putative tricarboxylic transport membrane protein
MLAGIYYGSMYGGSTTSICVNIPGEASSVVTTIDGYQLAKQGRAGSALAIAAVASFTAGTLAVVGLFGMSPLVADFALRFGPPEFFSLMVLSLTIVIYISVGSVLRAVMAGLFGMALGTIGWDVVFGQSRNTFGIEYLADGVPVIPVVMGLFGISEVLLNIEKTERIEVFKDIGSVYPSLKDLKESFLAILRGSGIGFFLGLLPGGGPIIAPFASYSVEKKVSKRPERFGTGAIEGVAGPEAANNAAVQSGFIPLLTLGIPTTPTFALFLAALLIHGIHSGPMLLTEHPDLFWGVIISMYFGNIMLLILNLPLIRMWVEVLKIPYSLLAPLVLAFCLIGSVAESGKVGDTFVMLVFGIIGYLMRKFGYEPAPMIIAFILTPVLELNFRQSMIISHGSFGIFFSKPISLICLIVTACLYLMAALRKNKATRPKLGAEE